MRGLSYKLLFVLVLASIVLFGCKRKEPYVSSYPPWDYGDYIITEKYANFGSSSDENDSGSSYAFTRSPVLHTITSINDPLPNPLFTAIAHSQYLRDPLIFKDMPDGGYPEGDTAVVGSDVCYFYPVQTVTKDTLNKLPKGELIPFATIIPIEEVINNNDPYSYMFNFQDHYNSFYKTTWNGKQGIVFGADLFGIRSSNQDNRLHALLYKGNGHFSDFHPVTGYEPINDVILNDLTTMGIAFQKVNYGHGEYWLNEDTPDDMIALYMNLVPNDDFRRRKYPIFVTTDLAAHANHLVFGRMLQYIEENYFFPRLKVLTDKYIEIIEEKKEEISEDVYNTSILYFQTAKALLELAPVKFQRETWYPVEYKDVNTEEVLKNYPSKVVEQVSAINSAEGYSALPVFDWIKNDYSQYKVRGHYTKNGVLGAYFRALMWYGTINFNLGGIDPALIESARKFAPAALFITDITENSDELKILWLSLFDPITELIGASDDISFYELVPLWNRIKGAGFAQWYNDPSKRRSFIEKEYKELRPPSITGSSFFQVLQSNRTKPQDMENPVGWRLFGQRYTLDSEIHHHLSTPRIKDRQMVQGLDIMKVFGSKTADRLLEANEYKKYSGLKDTMNKLQTNLSNLKDDYWLSTYYTNILYQIRTQALFENGTGFYFTEKPGWNLKALNSALGTWAELRHDTILYVKQPHGAERAGGDGDGTFRTKPLPEPVHYIEPNVPFWVTSALGVQKLYSIIEKYGYMDGETAQALTGLHNIFVRAAAIAKLETEDKPVSQEDLRWIKQIANELARLVLTHVSGLPDSEQLKMALVADVYTNLDFGAVLETAVGIPHRLYIPLNDKQGGKRIAVGYGFSYYEFAQDVNQRLNNEEWKAIVYEKNTDMEKYYPYWMQGTVRPAK